MTSTHYLPETLDAHKFPCPCVTHHQPEVHRTQGHHVLPQYAGGQTTAPSQPGYTKLQALCPTGHDAVHMLLDQWAGEEAAYLADGGNISGPGAYEPPATSNHNHIHHTVALRGWHEFKGYWPDQPFPRLHAVNPPTPGS